ncbi:MAG TPA: hypothetical protein VK968_00135, partial [Roseimicrobium sp.]|nr:hypothetical protein [Roseimicrobium sp.]
TRMKGSPIRVIRVIRGHLFHSHFAGTKQLNWPRMNTDETRMCADSEVLRECGGRDLSDFSVNTFHLCPAFIPDPCFIRAIRGSVALFRFMERLEIDQIRKDRNSETTGSAPLGFSPFLTSLRSLQLISSFEFRLELKFEPLWAPQSLDSCHSRDSLGDSSFAGLFSGRSPDSASSWPIPLPSTR